MREVNHSSVEEFKILSHYENLRKVLLGEQYVGHLTKPLAFWALPSDRRLPLAFLGRSLKDLLSTPFRELAATPGIGQKKIRSFIKLLARAASTNASEIPDDPSLESGNGESDCGNGRSSNGKGFDPSSVSEVVWAQWRTSVMRHALENESLGRFAPSLRNVTRVIWNTPLKAYTGVTLDDLRRMKTHGEKRVRAVLEVFHSVHALVSSMGTQDHLVVRIVPRRIDGVERWVAGVLQRAGIPHEDDIREYFVQPLLEQIRTDAGQQIASLAESRLGIHRPITSVRQAARTMGLTRARVYQLLNEINDIMAVRWPNGRRMVYELREKLESEAAAAESPPDLQQLFAAIELFYPSKRRGADGPLDPVAQESEPAEKSA
jgi:hypothetical protein